MENKNEESEKKSWESSKSESSEEMPMQNYNTCMYCPMMYGNVNMQGSQIMPKYDEEGSREEEK